MNTTLTDILFQPLKIKSLELKNRFVMAPMTRSFSPNGVPGENVAQYYRRRAEAEVGLILSEGTVIDRPAARNDPNVPFFHGDAALAGWKAVIDGVHDAGGKMAPQIWHVGASPSQKEWVREEKPESPSGLAGPDLPNGVAMTESDIADTIAAYGKAAGAAKALGFDTLEIHGAHGYLIDEFFWSATNQRTDKWGGPTIKERSRFAVEVVREVRKAVGEDFPIILRLSQWKVRDYTAKTANNPDELADWLLPLREAGVDVFHCSQRIFNKPEFEGSDLNFAGWAKKITGAFTISVGSVGLDGDVTASFSGQSSQVAGLDELRARLEREEFDMIAVGRALLGDPQWVQKVKEGRFSELRPFDPASFAELY